jgi:transmembrane sensor
MNQPGAPSEEALRWFVRSNDPEFDDWEGFTAWLERDPAHADAWHRLAAAEGELLPVVAEEQAVVQDVAPVQATGRGRRGWLAGGAVAAAIAALVAVPSLRSESVLTRPGEQRTIALADGNRLLLNGDTEVRIAGWNRDKVRVERGQALFKLAGKDRVAVEVGDLSLVDIGTTFEVSRDGSGSQVIVAEGAVLADPGGAKVRIDAGQQLATFDGATRLRPTAAPDGAAGAWTRGQLVFIDASLPQVAAELRRSTGLAFSAKPASGARRFTGTLNLADARRDPGALSALLGVPVRPAGGGWVLGED